LYNLRNDLGETRDLAAQMPDKANELRARLHAWRQQVGAQMPTVNPNYDPAKPQHIPPAGKQKQKQGKQGQGKGKGKAPAGQSTQK
jgi:hypothetical protein